MRRISRFPLCWHCYLLLCADGSYYCGIASDLAARLRDHASGKGSSYTKKLKPVALVWIETHPNRRSAAAREKQIKAWSHEKKRQLANGEQSSAGFGSSVSVSLS